MPSGGGGDGNVGTIIRLHHRRRGWAWAGFGSLIGLLAYVFIGNVVFTGLTGANLTATYVPMAILFVIAAVGIIAVLVDTVRLRRAGKTVRDAAREKVTHHPVHAHVFRRPHHVGSWLMGIFMVTVITILMTVFIPGEVDGAAYLLGAGRQTTFHADSYGRECGKGGCSTVTDGYLSDSGTRARVLADMPLGATKPVREPVWNWGTGRGVIESTGQAAGQFGIGFVFNIPLFFLGYGLAKDLRGRRRKARLAPATVKTSKTEEILGPTADELGMSAEELRKSLGLPEI